MLKGIDPLLGPELLAHLRSMGHGDEVLIADANFPAAANARRLVRMDGVNAAEVLAAVVSVLPLDTYSDAAVFVMEIVGASSLPPIAEEFRSIVAKRCGEKLSRVVGIERFAFYDRARSAYAVVATGERRLYGNVILRKGIIEI